MREFHKMFFLLFFVLALVNDFMSFTDGAITNGIYAIIMLLLSKEERV